MTLLTAGLPFYLEVPEIIVSTLISGRPIYVQGLSRSIVLRALFSGLRKCSTFCSDLKGDRKHPRINTRDFFLKIVNKINIYTSEYKALM